MTTQDMQLKNFSSRKILRSYVLGYLLCLALTLFAFYVVYERVYSSEALVVWVVALAVVQFLVQTFFFLRFSTGKNSEWNVLSFIFSLIIIAILVCGSLWIMYNLNYHMVH